jgi:hypothetical protein
MILIHAVLLYQRVQQRVENVWIPATAGTLGRNQDEREGPLCFD